MKEMIGKQLGTYQISEKIGQGGMATVYRAYQANMDRYVAVKVIRGSALSDPGMSERFQREARVIARLEHPHLLPIYDFDGAHDPPFIAMRFLEGGTLKQVIEGGGLPRGEVLHVLDQVSSALDYAHRQGVVHRDLKPSNIMVDREGNAFITDFGIARIGDSVSDLTGTGVTMGTPGYMAPEQIRGEVDIDARADIYSLGVIIYELLAGQPPFQPENVAGMLVAHLQEPVPDITGILSDLPAQTDAIFHKVMAKDRYARYETAGAFASELKQVLAADGSSPPAQLRSLTAALAVDQIEALTAGEEEAETGSSSGEQQRLITALQVDLTELAEILYLSEEPDTARQKMDDMWRRIKQIVLTYGGLFQRHAGETGQALWGVEAAHEDDPEQSIRAALDMQAIVAKMTADRWDEDEELPPFKAGITTGLILLEYEQGSSDYTVTGQAITLAGRLKDAAPPGGILVAHDTFSHVRGVFDFRQLPPIRMRGRMEPLEVYLVLRAKPRAFRRPTRGVEGVETAMVGREAELKLLQDALSLTIEDRETQVVTIVGEAGVGKSRLLYEFSNWIDLIDEQLWLFQARAVQPAMLQPYSLTRDLFAFRFQILDSDPRPVVHEKFISGVAGFLGSGTAGKSRLMGHFIGFDFSDSPAVQTALENLDQFEEQALSILGEFFSAAARINPVMIQIEDIHWADDHSLDLINVLLRDNLDLPLFVICMARPSLFDRRPQWGEGQDFHARINLEPLSRLDSRRLIREILKKIDKVPTELRDFIADRAEGNPFYVEELVKILIDDGIIIKGEEKWGVDLSRLATVRVPPTLTGVLQARLDTLTLAQRSLLQRAAVVGRIFWDGAVVHLGTEEGLTPATVSALLADLHRREMIYQREESAFMGTTEFVFRHALLRDVTYDSLLPRQRREYHALVAEWLIEISGGRVEEYNLLIAEHFKLADDRLQAAEYLGKAGASIQILDQALAITLQAVELLEDMNGQEEEKLHLRLRLQLGRLYWRKGLSRQALSTLRPVVDEAREKDEQTVLVDALVMMGANVRAQGDPQEAVRIGQEALVLARRLDRPLTTIRSLQLIGFSSLELADQATALRSFQEALALAKEIGHDHETAHSLTMMGHLATFYEEWDEALEYYNEAAELGRSIGDRQMMARELANYGYVAQSRGDYDGAQEPLEESLRLSRELGWYYGLAYTLPKLAWTALTQGKIEKARNYLAEGLRIAQTTDYTQPILYAVIGYARLRAATGRLQESLEILGVSMQHPSYHIGDQGWEVRYQLAELREKMDEDEIQAGLERGAKLKFDEVVNELLAEDASPGAMM